MFSWFKKRKQPALPRLTPAEEHLIETLRQVHQLTHDEHVTTELFETVAKDIYLGEAPSSIEVLVYNLIEWDKKLPAELADELLKCIETDNPEKPYTMGLREKLVQK